MRNKELEKFNVLVGHWRMTISDAWFLEPRGIEVHGTATIDWLGESFLVVRSKFEDNSETSLVFGRSDPNDQFIALYHDDRGVCRVFAMTFDDRHWTMTRDDPDFHQRFIAEVETNRIIGRWEASEDQGKNWRKDFDLTFVRRTADERDAD